MYKLDYAPFQLMIVRLKPETEMRVHMSEKYHRITDARTACMCPSVCLIFVSEKKNMSAFCGFFVFMCVQACVCMFV